MFSGLNSQNPNPLACCYRFWADLSMEENEQLVKHTKELAKRCYERDVLTHTPFLSPADLAAVYDAMRKDGENLQARTFAGAPYVTFGGYEDAERQCLIFLPSYEDADTFLMGEEEESQVVSCLRADPVNRHFADDLTHRDFLGALMNLGIERDRIGDILIEESTGYLFVLKDMADYIRENLTRVRHTMVTLKEIPNRACTARPKFEEIEGSVASERIDAVIGMVFHLSRGKAQELIEAQSVIIDGRTAWSGGYDLKQGARVSVRGQGKFRYLGVVSETRKGRLYVKVQKYV